MSEHSEKLPNIEVYRFPENERSSCERVKDALSRIDHHISGFEFALKLFDTCENARAFAEANRAESFKTGPPSWDSTMALMKETSIYHQWIFIAARDGAMQIFHVDDSINALSRAMKGARTLASYVDHGKLDIAKGVFDGSFPHCRAIRHAVGHEADFSSKISEHATRDGLSQPGMEVGKGGLLMISGSLIGRKFMATYEGKKVEYEISAGTRDRLRSILARITESFADLAPAIRLLKKGETLQRREREGPRHSN